MRLRLMALLAALAAGCSTTPPTPPAPPPPPPLSAEAIAVFARAEAQGPGGALVVNLDAIEQLGLAGKGPTLHQLGGVATAVMAQLSAGEGEEARDPLADLATVAIVRSGHVDMGAASLSVRRALQGRTVIERAKGVLAYTRSVDMVTAYDLLVQLTEESGLTLSETAASVIRQAQRQPSAE